MRRIYAVPFSSRTNKIATRRAAQVLLPIGVHEDSYISLPTELPTDAAQGYKMLAKGYFAKVIKVGNCPHSIESNALPPGITYMVWGYMAISFDNNQ